MKDSLSRGGLKVQLLVLEELSNNMLMLWAQSSSSCLCRVASVLRACLAGNACKAGMVAMRVPFCVVTARFAACSEGGQRGSAGAKAPYQKICGR